MSDADGKKLNWIQDLIKKSIGDKFTGSITINFFGGGVTNINVNQSLKPPAI